MESKLLVKERQLVVPGDVLAVGIDYLPGKGCFRDGPEIKSKYLGLTKIKDRLISTIPISGIYIPRPGDGIIGIVNDMQSTFWIININSPYDAILQLGEAAKEYVDISKVDISTYYDIGDVIYAKVLNVTKSKSVQLTMNTRRAKKLVGGRLIRITPAKVPRLIGKEGSMIELIKEKTNCNIVVGQNGVVWLKGEKEALATKAILIIEKEAHITGLTDKITKFFEENKGSDKNE